jgi:Fe-S-cluster containining protein
VRSADELAAGDFSRWLIDIQRALRGEGASDVPCHGCTACCTSSQFIPIGPDETDTLSHIPPDLLFPAPGRPSGHVVLGYDERGHCPMLVDGKCTIYEHRPQTCRTYDCRVLAAARIELIDKEKSAIAQRARQWRFTVAGPAARAQQDAVVAAARYLEAHPNIERDATQRAVLAVALHDLFVGDETPTETNVRAEVGRRRSGAAL